MSSSPYSSASSSGELGESIHWLIVRALQGLAFCWVTVLWLACSLILWHSLPGFRLVTIPLLGGSLGFLAYQTLRHRMDSRWAAAVPVFAETREIRKRLDRRRGNKYLRHLYPSIEAANDGKPLDTYLRKHHGGLTWHIPGDPMIGTLEDVRATIEKALGRFEKDFGVHYVIVEQAPGQRQQYIARFFKEAPEDPLDEGRPSKEQGGGDGPVTFGIEEDNSDDR